MTDEQLLRQATREAATSVIVVSHAFLRQPEAIIYKPGELAALFGRTSCVQAVSAAFVQAANPKIGDAETDHAT